ncbi:MAG TPA: glutamate-cysteine ligase family protein [Casimicrobiaceae bacterium]|nr:glutamate-cysteine ligase family protein [Casimicrobiaceae bacterium]
MELEYMIVDRESLAVRPIAPTLLAALGETRASKDSPSVFGWSNELVQHVVEIKNMQPTPNLASLPAQFQREIDAANRLLARYNARLMPTAMHPWMDPRSETHLWDDDIYRTYDRIYDCRGHGWANLQSMHVNLPFADDAEFARLHAAVRLVLPLLPALAASSPIAEGASTGLCDYRVDAYCRICAITPRVSGAIVPDTIDTRAEYEAKVLRPMYDEIAYHDPQGVLAHEWLNSRGAIPRFDRNAIEIRVIDVQECPRADLAIAGATCAVVKSLFDERYAPLDEQQAIPTDVLQRVLAATTRDADFATVDDAQYLHALGMATSNGAAGDIWRSLLDDVADGDAWWQPAIDVILREGPLARRILRALGNRFDEKRLRSVYRTLCQCLEHGWMFE